MVPSIQNTSSVLVTVWVPPVSPTPTVRGGPSTQDSVGTLVSVGSVESLEGIRRERVFRSPRVTGSSRRSSGGYGSVEPPRRPFLRDPGRGLPSPTVSDLSPGGGSWITCRTQKCEVCFPTGSFDGFHVVL